MQKKHPKRNMRKMLVRLLFTGVLLYSGIVLAGQQYSMYNKEKIVEEWKASNAAAKNENARLKEEKGLVNTDEYKERKARELLDYVRPEETVYIDVTK